jgi:hypothetical protein
MGTDFVAQRLILYPVFAMFLLVVIVFLRMRSLRFAAVRNREVPVEYYRAFTGAEEPENVRVVSRHFANLFEVPVLFYVVVIMTNITNQATYWLVALAWAYVVLRYAHTYVHLTSNDVIVRFSFYLASGIVLAVMWVALFLKLVLPG